MPILAKSNSALYVITLGLTAVLTACAGGASNPPDAQAANEQSTTPSNSAPVNTGENNSATDNTTETADNPEQENGENNQPATVAVDLSTPVFCDTDKQRFQEVMLTRINAARAQGRACGNDNFPAVASVKWNNKLQSAAEVHSLDMTAHNFFSHTGSDGSSVSARADAQSYDWVAIGENIAAGQETAQEVIEGWLSSEGHCRNLMSSNYTEIAVACIADENTDYTRYWTNVLGAPAVLP